MILRASCLLLALAALTACSQGTSDTTVTTPKPAANAPKAESPLPPLDPTNIVSIAAGSKDHTTLVAAAKAADYVRSLANPGPLTVFAPTNAAFDKLPKGTVEELVKPEKKADLQEILKYHVTTTAYDIGQFKDGMVLAMANGKKVTFHVKGDKVMVNDATIVGSVHGSNGWVHIVDSVLLPPAK